MKLRYTSYLFKEHVDALKAMAEKTQMPVSSLIGLALDGFLHPLGWINVKYEAPYEQLFLMKNQGAASDIRYVGASGSATIVPIGKAFAVKITLHGKTTKLCPLAEGVRCVNIKSVVAEGITIGMGASKACENEQFLAWEEHDEQ